MALVIWREGDLDMSITYVLRLISDAYSTKMFMYRDAYCIKDIYVSRCLPYQGCLLCRDALGDVGGLFGYFFSAD